MGVTTPSAMPGKSRSPLDWSSIPITTSGGGESSLVEPTAEGGSL